MKISGTIILVALSLVLLGIIYANYMENLAKSGSEISSFRQEDVWPDWQEQVFRGSIGDSQITATLSSDSMHISGRYYYEKNRREFNIHGRFSGVNQVWLEETDIEGNITGSFNGEVSNSGHIVGEWQKPYGDRIYAFQLTAEDK